MPAPVRTAPAAADERLSLNEAAARLGVHYMTAYRYVRAGLLEATQEAGVWRVRPDAVDDFDARRRTDAARAGRRPRGATTPPIATARRAAALADRMVAGDEAGAWTVVEAALASGTPLEDVYLVLVCRALTIVGERWVSGAIGVAGEHRASVVAMRVIGRLGARCTRPGRTRGTVVLAAAPGDRHGMPTAILADVLRLRGLRVVDLGADVPPDELAAAAASADRLLGVGVCATTTPDRHGTRELASMVASVRTEVDRPVLLGGAAMKSRGQVGDLARRVGAEPGGPDAGSALEFFGRLVSADRRR